MFLLQVAERPNVGGAEGLRTNCCQRLQSRMCKRLPRRRHTRYCRRYCHSKEVFLLFEGHCMRLELPSETRTLNCTRLHILSLALACMQSLGLARLRVCWRLLRGNTDAVTRPWLHRGSRCYRVWHLLHRLHDRHIQLHMMHRWSMLRGKADALALPCLRHMRSGRRWRR